MKLSSNELPPMKLSQPSSLKATAARGASWVTLEMLGIQITLFIVFVVMSHYVEPRDFGLINISFMAVQTLQMIFLYNIDTPVARKQKAEDIEYTTAFWIGIAVSIFGFAALLILSFFVDRIFKAPGLGPVFRAMSIILLFMALSRVHETWMLRHFKYKSMALRGLVGAASGAIVGILLAVKGFGVMALVGQQVTNSVITMFLLWWICPWQPNLAFSGASAKEIFAFLRSIVPNSLLYTLNQNCDTFLIALFFGPVSAGVYNIGKRLRLMLQLVIGVPINRITLPSLAEIQNNSERFKSGILNLLTLVCIGVSPVFLGFSAVSQEIVNVIFGAKWTAAGPAVALLSLSGMAIVLQSFGDIILAIKNQQKISLFISLSYSVLAISGFAVIFWLKLDSLALPFVLPYLILLPASSLMVARSAGISPTRWIMAMLPGVASAALMFILIKLIGTQLSGRSDIERLFILVLVGVTVYVVLVVTVWRSATLKIRDIIRQLFHR